MMSSIRPRIEADLRRFERKIGIDREGRTVWVWLLPPGIGLITACLAPFMPGLPDSMGLIYRLALSLFGFITMTAIASIYLISFDNDHNQQAPVDGPEQTRGDDRGPQTPPAPSGPPPPAWIHHLETLPESKDEEHERDGHEQRPKVPAVSGAGR
jgi:hypothetical protein